MPGPDEKYKFVDIHPFHQRNRTKWVSFLKKLDGVTVFKDGSISVQGDVKFPEQGLTHIPFYFREVGGSFSIKKNTIKSLEGCPRKVGYIFDISRNPLLKNFDHAPEEVGQLDANNCGLISLENCPNTSTLILLGNHDLTSLLGGPSNKMHLYDVSHCNLSSLDGAPKEVDIFDCSSNANLKSLVGGPETCSVFSCRNTSIESMEGAPINITQSIDMSENKKLRSLKGLPLSDNINYQHENTPITKKEFDDYVDLQRAKKTESEETREFYKDDFEDF